MQFPSIFSPSSVVRGSESHKMIDLSGNPVLRIYYTSRVSISCPSKPWAEPWPQVRNGTVAENREEQPVG
jgi:hypothetical protein